MTRAQQRVTAVFMAALLAICCAIMFAPQKAQADPQTNTNTNTTTTTTTTTTTATTAAGTTSQTAKAMTFTTKRNLLESDPGYFNSKEMSKFYRFTTSDRNSTYRIIMSELDQDDVDVILYDSGYREIDRWSTQDRLRRSYAALDRSGTYYIELRRFSNWTARADYKIKFKEVITVPLPVTNLKVSSPSKGKITVKYHASTNATGYKIQTRRDFGTNRKPFAKKTSALSYTYKVQYPGNRYQVRVRPYRTVNGKAHYGRYSAWVNVNVKS